VNSRTVRLNNIFGRTKEMDILSQVSVVVCTKDRPTHLKECLRSIVTTDWPCKELIVVDSSTDSTTKRINESFVNQLGGKYYYESKKGLSAARNRGIRESSGNIIVFADDDFIVQKGWITHLVAHYKNPDVACCTGRMLPYRSDAISQLFEESLSFDKGTKRRFFSKKDISLRALLNAAIRASLGRKRLGGDAPVPWAIGNGYFSLRKTVLYKVGYFYEDLGIGTPSLGGEEIEMFYRILKSGYQIVYEPKGVILHNHRQTYDEVLKAAYNAGASERAFLRKYYYKSFYVASLLIAILILRILTWLRTSFNSKPELTYVEYMKLKGFFHKPRIS